MSTNLMFKIEDAETVIKNYEDQNNNNSKQNNFERLYNLLKDLNNETSVKKIVEINNKNIFDTQQFKDIVNCSIIMREKINNERGVTKISKFVRKNEHLISFQSAFSELIFSKFLFTHYKKNTSNYKNYNVKTPETASFFVDHSCEDFVIQNNLLKENISFDIKSQFVFNEKFNVNLKAHNRAKTHNNNYYILCVINSKIENYDEVESACFYCIPFSFLEKNAEIVECRNGRFTSFYSLSLNKIL